MRAKLKRLTFYLQKKRKLLLLVLAPFSLFSLILFFSPHPAYAISLDFVTEPLSRAFLGMAETFFKGGIWAVNVAISFTSSFLNNGAETVKAWRQSRDTALSLFGIAILVIAFMNLLRIQIQVWGVNRMIPKLFLAIFAVVFSKFICISVINFATALASTFFSNAMFGKFNGLVGGSGVSIFQDTADKSFSTVFAVVVFSIISFCVLMLLAIILFFRAVVLALLVIVSPLAFALTVLPWTMKYFQEWWKNFLKWTFFFPVCIIILTFGFALIPGQPDPNPPAQVAEGTGTNYFCRVDPKDPKKYLPNDPEGCVPPYQLSEGETNDAASSFFGMIASLAVGLVAVVLSVFLPLKMLGAFGAVAGDILSGKKAIPGAPAFMSPKAARDWLGDRSKKVATRRRENFTNMMRRGFGEGRIGQFATGETAQDRAALRGELAKTVGAGPLSKDERRLYAQGKLAPHNLSGEKQAWLSDFERRGGNSERAIDFLTSQGQLNHDTALAAQDYLQSKGDWDTALKDSSLHHLRTKTEEVTNPETGKVTTETKAFPLYEMSSDDFAKTITPNIHNFRSGQLGMDSAKMKNTLSGFVSNPKSKKAAQDLLDKMDKTLEDGVNTLYAGTEHETTETLTQEELTYLKQNADNLRRELEPADQGGGQGGGQESAQQTAEPKAPEFSAATGSQAELQKAREEAKKRGDWKP